MLFQASSRSALMRETLERWLDREALARRICTKTNMVPRLVDQGKLPRPSLHLGPRSPRWDIHAVDAAMLEASGVSVPSTINDMVQKACDDIERDAARRKNRSKAAR